MSDLPEMSSNDLLALVADGEPIRDVQLVEARLERAGLAEAEFYNVTFVRCGFNESEFFSSQFEDCRFVDCRFSHADLTETQFERCNFFDRESSSSADFSYARLTEARFVNCNLSGSRFVGAELFDVSIRDCKANGAQFREASFARSIGGRDAVVRGQILNSIFDDSDLSDLNLEGMQLADTSFTRADLSGAILMDADMAGCDIAGANLRKANFERTDLRRGQLGDMSLAQLSGYQGMKISEDQQSQLLAQLGIHVYP